jgi:hypothetical protein
MSDKTIRIVIDWLAIVVAILIAWLMGADEFWQYAAAVILAKVIIIAVALAILHFIPDTTQAVNR